MQPKGQKKNAKQIVLPREEEKPSPAWKQALWFVAAAWAAFSLLKFYQQQPFSHLVILDTLIPEDFSLLPTLSAFLNYLHGLLMALSILSGAYLLGRIALARWISSVERPLETVTVSTALGYGLVAYLSFLLGVLKLYYRPVFWGLAAVFFIGALLWSQRETEKLILKGAWRQFRDALFSGGWGHFFGCVFLFILATDFVMAFVPELFYDALVYHLGVPNFFLHEHRIAAVDVLPSKFPFTIQMIWVMALALKNEIVSKLTHFIFLALLSCAMIALGYRLERKRTGVFAALLFCSIPTVQLNVWTSGVDMGVSLFAFLATYCFFIRDDVDQKNLLWFVLSALFTGFSLGSKYTVIYIPVIIFIVGAIEMVYRKHSIVAEAKQWILFGAIAFAILSPWLVKNWLEMGNPVYPFLAKFFHGTALEPAKYAQLRGENTGLLIKSFNDLVTIFWKLSIVERSSLSYQGPLFLALIPFSFLLIKEALSPTAKKIILWALIFIPIGLATTRLTRYLLPGLTCVALALGIVVERLIAKPKIVKKVLIAAILFIGVLYQMSSAYIIIRQSYKPRDVLIGRESRNDFAGHFHTGMNPYPALPIYPYVEKTVPADARVLILGDEKSYPLQRRYMYSGVYDKNLIFQLAEESDSSQALQSKLLERGFRYILVNSMEGFRLSSYGTYAMSPKAFGVFCAFWQQFLRADHAEDIKRKDGETNNLFLFEVMGKRKIENVPDVHNFVADIYERAEFPKMNLISDADKIAFYKARLQEQPNTEFFAQRLHSLSVPTTAVTDVNP